MLGRRYTDLQCVRFHSFIHLCFHCTGFHLISRGGEHEFKFFTQFNRMFMVKIVSSANRWCTFVCSLTLWLRGALEHLDKLKIIVLNQFFHGPPNETVSILSILR